MEHTKTLEIINKLGLHARAAAKLIQLAAGYQAGLKITKAARTVDGKSMLNVMMLAASQGTILTFTAQGTDSAEMLDAIEALIARRFDEDA